MKALVVLIILVGIVWLVVRHESPPSASAQYSPETECLNTRNAGFNTLNDCVFAKSLARGIQRDRDARR